MAEQSDDVSTSFARERREFFGIGSLLLIGQFTQSERYNLSNESANGSRGSRVVDAQGSTFAVSAPGQGWYATNPVITKDGRGIGSGDSLLYWKQTVYVHQTTGQWFKWTGSTLVTVGNADPTGIEVIPPTQIAVPKPIPSADCIRATYTEAQLAAGVHPDLIYLSFAKDRIGAQGFTNFYTNHIREFKLINRVWFAKHGSFGTNSDGSTYLTPTLCSWSKPLPVPLEQCWASWTLIIDPDVKLGLTELGIKLHGISGNQNGFPVSVADIKTSDRRTLPARYLLGAYEYHQDGTAQLFVPSRAYMYEGHMHTIDVGLRMNTPGVANGRRELWIDDQRVIFDNNVNFRSNSNALFSSVSVQIFAGGTGRPAREIHVWSGPMLIHPTLRPGMLRTV